MRIISKFHDYYDNAGAVDFSYNWNREQINNPLLTEYGWTGPSGRDIDKYVTILFCGKVYLGVQLVWAKHPTMGCKYDWFWGEKLVEKLEGNKVWKEMYLRQHGVQSCHDTNLRYKAPIIIIEGRKYWRESNCIINGNLSKYEFAKQINPFDARQMIEQFLKNDLAVKKFR